VISLVLVRHGRAAARWDANHDPGLDDVGREQAEAMAGAVAPLGPLPVLVSPLRRTRETAAALERRWGVTAGVEPAVSEVPSPTTSALGHAAGDLAERAEWLRRVLPGRWPDLPVDLQLWRQALLDVLTGRTEDTVVVTHYVAVNAAVGAATGDHRVVCFRPANCSRTVLEVDGGRLRLVELGEQAVTAVR
jgi:broad specificity phosphatase PhoE